MINSNFDDVGDFHEKFDLDNTTHHLEGPREFDSELIGFRVNFMLEELGEFIEALGWKVDVSDIAVAGARSVTVTIDEDSLVDHAKAFDALLDLVYVAMGTAHFMGYPWQEGWDRVQKANMSKERALSDGSNSLRGSSFDVVKPEGWEPPNIEGVLKSLGWEINE